MSKIILEELTKNSDRVYEKCNNPQVKVACILDPFSFDCFKFECSLFQLSVKEWRLQLEGNNPDFVFVESAWEAWDFDLVRIQNKPGSEIRKLISYCKKNKITTVFWNKEDSLNYVDFIETAKLFDYVFTTDENCLDLYKKEVRHNRVYVLSFAAQPMIHNPINSRKIGDVAFAGSWFNHPTFEERRTDMELILDPARQYNLQIFDRKYNMPKPNNFAFPEKYASNIVGGLPYSKMVQVYKMFRIFLNVNSIKDSSTMFSRRVYELLACGTCVVSTYSKGISETFHDIVPIVETSEDTERVLKKMLNNHNLMQIQRVLGIRAVYEKHLYEHRFNYVLQQIGINYRPRQSVGVSVISCFPDNFDELIDNYYRQSIEIKELIVVIKKRDEPLYTKFRNHQNINIISVADNSNETESYNAAIKKSENGIISIFCDKCYYGEYFLSDLITSYKYTDAEVVGKKSYYTYLKSQEQLIISYPEEEYLYDTKLCMKTLVVKKDVFRKITPPINPEDYLEELLKSFISQGIGLFANDSFNFINFDSSIIEKKNSVLKSHVNKQDAIQAVII